MLILIGVALLIPFAFSAFIVYLAARANRATSRLDRAITNDDQRFLSSVGATWE